MFVKFDADAEVEVVSLEGVDGVDASSRGTLSKIVFAFSSWTSLKMIKIIVYLKRNYLFPLVVNGLKIVECIEKELKSMKRS